MRSQWSCRIGGTHDCCKWVNERTWTLISTDLKVDTSLFDVEYSWIECCSTTSTRTLIMYVDGMQNRQLIVHEYDHWRIHIHTWTLVHMSWRVYVFREPRTRNHTLQSLHEHNVFSCYDACGVYKIRDSENTNVHISRFARLCTLCTPITRKCVM